MIFEILYAYCEENIAEKLRQKIAF